MKYQPSGLRYPGGKFKALKQILPLIPGDITEFREPFVGGGSVMLNVKNKCRQRWINDANLDVATYWRMVQRDNLLMCIRLEEIWYTYQNNGLDLYKTLKNSKHLSPLETAIKFFILNRISYAGIGGYSQTAFDGRWTLSSIQRIADLDKKLLDVVVTAKDYRKLLEEPGTGVFIFLDPPYYSARNSKLYQGHMDFDHLWLAESLKQCTHNWLMTIDDCPEIRCLYEGWADITPWELGYSMGESRKGKELFVCPK